MHIFYHVARESNVFKKKKTLKYIKSKTGKLCRWYTTQWVVDTEKER